MPVVNISLQVIPRVSDERIYEVIDKVIAYIDSCETNMRLDQWKHHGG